MGRGSLWNLTLAGGRICRFGVINSDRVVNIVGLTKIDKETSVGSFVEVKAGQGAVFYASGALLGGGAQGALFAGLKVEGGGSASVYFNDSQFSATALVASVDRDPGAGGLHLSKEFTGSFSLFDGSLVRGDLEPPDFDLR